MKAKAFRSRCKTWGARAAESRLKPSSLPTQTVCELSGELLKTSAIAGVSGHAILPGFMTLAISQAQRGHYSRHPPQPPIPEEFCQAPGPQVL